MLISLLILILFSNALTMRRDKSILLSRTVIIGLVLTSYIAYTNLYVRPLENGIGVFGGLFNVTTFTHSFNIFILMISALILILTSFYPRKIYLDDGLSIYNLLSNKISYNKINISNKNGEQYKIIEYSLIIVFILCGALFLISSGDLISVFLSIELQSYGLYILSTLYRDSETSTASGLTYFLLGGLSSCFILLGSALLYINSGTTSLDNIYVISGINDITNFSILMYEPYYFNIAFIIMFIGFLFKVSAAPFHFWSPDVYDGIPTIVTTYVAIVAKISLFAFLLEIVHYTDYEFFSFNWKNILILSSLFSLIIGSILGLTQFRIKRLFAYSTISHVGFILLALSINTTESIQSYIFYILQYSLSNLNAFIIIISIGYSLFVYVYNNEKTKEDLSLWSDNYSPVQLINQIKGYFYVNQYIAISLGITLFSFVGIPPIIGFFAKQMILSAAIDSGYVFMALVAIITSVIGAGYYLNLIKQIFFFKNDYIINPKIENINVSVHNNSLNMVDKSTIQNNKIIVKWYNIAISSSLSVSISVITLLLLLFIYMPEEWFSIVSMLTLMLFRA